MKDLGIGCHFDEYQNTSFLIYEHEYGLFIQDERLNSKFNEKIKNIFLIRFFLR